MARDWLWEEGVRRYGDTVPDMGVCGDERRNEEKKGFHEEGAVLASGALPEPEWGWTSETHSDRFSWEFPTAQKVQKAIPASCATPSTCVCPTLTHRSDRRAHCMHVWGVREGGKNDPAARGKTMRGRPDRLAMNDTLSRMFRDDENG